MTEITDEEKAVLEAAKKWRAVDARDPDIETMVKLLTAAVDALPKSYESLLSNGELGRVYNDRPPGGIIPGLRAVEVFTIRKLAKKAEDGDGPWGYLALNGLADAEEGL